MIKATWLVSAALAAAVIAPTPAGAQQYPGTDAIHFICAYAAGSGSDIVVRHFADRLRALTGKTIIVENKVGAGGNIAMEYVSRAKPNGYTVLVHAGSAIAANMYLFKKPPFPDAGKALTVAAPLNRLPFVLLVNAKSPYQSVADLTAAMKAKGDKATYGTSAPTGTVMGELYKQATGVTAVEVNYKVDADSLNDMMSGAVEYGFHNPVFGLAQQREGRLRILGVSTPDRLSSVPDLPTMKEQGVPMDLTIWWAAMVPAGTPQPIVDQLNKWFVEIVSSPETKAFTARLGGDSLSETPEQAQNRLVNDVVRWKDYFTLAKIEPLG